MHACTVADTKPMSIAVSPHQAINELRFGMYLEIERGLVMGRMLLVGTLQRQRFMLLPGMQSS